MKIAITAQDNHLQAQVDPRFGRCKYFIVYDLENQNYEAIENRAADASSGAGVQSAQNVVDTGVKAVLTGRVGPKAEKGLVTGGVEIYQNIDGTVEQAIKDFGERVVKGEDGFED